MTAPRKPDRTDTPADRARREREAQGLPPKAGLENEGVRRFAAIARDNRKNAKAGER